MLNFLIHVLSILLITQDVLSSNPLLSIESPDGDINIDCVHMREQPALNHPLLHDHEIQETPAKLQKKINKMEEKEVWQVWNQNGRSCPDQTVPIRRSKVGDKKYTKKHWTNVYRTDPYATEQGHERDTYQNTGCLNLECPGFVQVSSDFTLGAAFSPISTYGGNQYDVTMSLWKDTHGGNWWFAIGQSLVGYWPSKLFTHLADGPAKLVQWGGEVVNTRSYGQHTTTQMGSGHFAEEGFGKTSFIRNLGIIDNLTIGHRSENS